MIVRKSVFSRLCNISRAAITDLCKKGNLVVSPDGKIDLSEPRNLQYLAKHNPKASVDAQNGTLEVGKDTGQESAVTIAVPDRKPNKPEKPRSIDSKQPSRPKSKVIDFINTRQKEEPPEDDRAPTGETGPMTEEEVYVSAKKPYYEALKSKAEAQLKSIQVDKEHGSLGEREVFDSFIKELWQSLSKNYIEIASRQAQLICKQLGVIGKEQEVIEILSSDIERRQNAIADEVKSILRGKLSKRIDEIEEPIE